MGVSGCGKSTVAERFAEQMTINFYDADDFHSPEAKAHMQSGKALTDDMRKPWIKRMVSDLQFVLQTVGSCTLAYSGLRAEQRQAFLELDAQVIFFHLVLPLSEVQHRLSKRSDHFFPPSLISSQYDSLEAPLPSENIIEIDATLSVAQLLKQLRRYIHDLPVFVEANPASGVNSNSAH